jgi:hypothetical protein
MRRLTRDDFAFGLVEGNEYILNDNGYKEKTIFKQYIYGVSSGWIRVWFSVGYYYLYHTESNKYENFYEKMNDLNAILFVTEEED